MQSARSRGAPIYCEINGWGMSSAPSPATDWPSDPAGPAAAMQKAMAMAGVGAADIDTVSAAASGGVRSDRLEARALERVFKGVRSPAVAALKGAMGESFASGGMRAAAMALSIRAGIVPPIMGLASPIIALDAVKSAPREMTINQGLVNACASGGTFAALLFRRPS
jgi:3-oxoacyl-[acyl-carrier-protein] synthase II